MSELYIEGHEANQNKKPRLEDAINSEIVESQQNSTNMDKILSLFVEMSEGQQEIERIQRLNSDRAKLIVPIVQEMSSDEIKVSFDLPACVELAQQFDECKTITEYQLLDVVEEIAKCAAEEQDEKQIKNYAEVFSQSGLRKKIEECIHAHIYGQDLEENEWMLGELIDQLARIYCYMTNVLSEYDETLSFFCGKIISENINCQVFIILSECEDLANNQDPKQDEFEVLKYQMEILNNLLGALQCGIRDKTQRIALQDDCDYFNDLSSLFHINCSDSLKCSHRIAFPESINPKQLHLLALTLLSQFTQSANKEILFGTTSKNVVAHLAPVIISFALNASFGCKQLKRTNQLSEAQSLSSLDPLQTLEEFDIYFSLLHNIVMQNNRYAYNIATYPNFLISLIELLQFQQQIQEYKLKPNNYTISKIKQGSIDILSSICKNCNESIQKQVLFDMKFIKLLIQAAGIKSGNCEENDLLIQSTHNCFADILTSLKKPLKNKKPKSYLCEEALEQIESEGGFEEFDFI